jgi:lipopolysaccharide export system protein LptA
MAISSLIPVKFKPHLALFLGMIGAIALSSQLQTVKAQPVPEGQALTVLSDIQEANSETGVITARGNVQIFYPARQIQATSAQAQYFSRERRLVLSGNVFVLQEGNTIRAETITYLVDESRFVAMPQSNRQVESIYLVQETEEQPASNPQPVSPPTPAIPQASPPPLQSP